MPSLVRASVVGTRELIADVSSLTSTSGALAEGKRIRPLLRSAEGSFPRERYVEGSLGLGVGRVGEGEVARNNIRSAASLSVGAGRGVDWWTLADGGPGGGVCCRYDDSVAPVIVVAEEIDPGGLEAVVDGI